MGEQLTDDELGDVLRRNLQECHEQMKWCLPLDTPYWERRAKAIRAELSALSQRTALRQAVVELAERGITF